MIREAGSGSVGGSGEFSYGPGTPMDFYRRIKVSTIAQRFVMA